MTVPEGAQLSEDGKYWWDGADWLTVPEDAGEQPAQVGQLSEDGQWQWDGSAWQPADGGSGGGGSGGGSGGSGLAEALAGSGIPIPAESADADYLRQLTEHVHGWYGGLDDISRTIVDSLSAQGCDELLADPEVGVVGEGDPLIAAFAANTMTLGESLQATDQALEQTAS
jgi:hypothetical protein